MYLPCYGSRFRPCINVAAVFVLLNFFIAIIMDAYEAQKELVASAEDVTAEELGKEVGVLLFDEGVFRVPCLGPCLKRCARRTKSTIRKTIDSLPSNARLNAVRCIE